MGGVGNSDWGMGNGELFELRSNHTVNSKWPVVVLIRFCERSSQASQHASDGRHRFEEGTGFISRHEGQALRNEDVCLQFSQRAVCNPQEVNEGLRRAATVALCD